MPEIMPQVRSEVRHAEFLLKVGREGDLGSECQSSASRLLRGSLAEGIRRGV